MKKIFGILLIVVMGLTICINDDTFAQRKKGGYGQYFGERHGRQHEGRFWNKLTEEQKAEVQAKIEELRAQGATREEIHAAVVELLEGYGIELPDGFKEGKGFRDGRRGLRHPFMKDLTKEQRAAVHKKIEEMRAQGATREEIHAAVVELLEGYGIELPEDFKDGKGFREGRRGPRFFFMKELTEEQRAEVMAKIEELRTQGATREEIHAAVVELLKGYGIELPEGWEDGKGFRQGRHGFRFECMEGLTDEQRAEIRAAIKEMREQGATRKEIHEAIMKMLEDWGIELPKNSPDEQILDDQKERLESSNYPNPFNPDTHIAYELKSPEQVTLRIYNINGQLIRTLVNEHQPTGSYTVHWDGCDDNNNRVVSGIYLYRIDAGQQSKTQRMIMVK